MMIAVKKEGGILRHISTGAWLQHDFIAGLTIMALLVPEGMAYAEVAGMPPKMVLYAAPMDLILYAIFDKGQKIISLPISLSLHPSPSTGSG